MEDSYTALHFAARLGRAKEADCLLAFKAVLEPHDSNGRTPLHHAAAAGHDAVVDLLVQKKANVDSVDLRGQSAAHLAAEADKQQALIRFRRASSPHRYVAAAGLWLTVCRHLMASLPGKSDPECRRVFSGL